MSADETMPANDTIAVANGKAPSSSPVKNNGGEEKPLFTPREEELLKIAMAHCLKSGPPEIDMQKFMTHGGFNTMKTTQNTWGKIKTKLAQAAGQAKTEDGEGGDGATATTTTSTPKTPASKKRKSPVKKVVKAEADAEAEVEDGEVVEGDGSPTEKKRKSPVKKVKAEEGAKGAE